MNKHQQYLKTFRSLKVSAQALLIAGALSLSACTNVPDAIQVAQGTSLLPFAKAQMLNQGNALDSHARWAGKIEGIEQTNSGLQLHVTYYESDATGRPKTSTDSVGHFVAKLPSNVAYSDVSGLKRGRLISVLGQFNQDLTAQNAKPTLNTDALHVWMDVKRAKTDPHNMIAVAGDKFGALDNASARSPLSFNSDNTFGNNTSSTARYTFHSGNSMSIVFNEQEKAPE